MSNNPVRRRFVDDAVVAFIVANLATGDGPIPVGLAELPGGVNFEDENRRYIVVTPVDATGQSVGPFTAAEQDAELEYDVRSCAGLGRGREGCQWLADDVRRIFFTRQSWGEPVNALTITKHTEIDRSTTGGFPAATLLDGEWQATDSIRITVTRSS